MSADLSRFHAVAPALHAAALEEIRRGRKDTHWMWFVFPQLRGLGRSAMARLYGLEPEEAAPYLADPVLGPRLLGVGEALLRHTGRRSALQIFGPVDALKLRSSMTLFAAQPGADPVFGAVLEGLCGHPCARTLQMLAAARSPAPPGGCGAKGGSKG